MNILPQVPTKMKAYIIIVSLITIMKQSTEIIQI